MPQFLNFIKSYIEIWREELMIYINFIVIKIKLILH